MAAMVPLFYYRPVYQAFVFSVQIQLVQARIDYTPNGLEKPAQLHGEKPGRPPGRITSNYRQEVCLSMLFSKKSNG